MLLTDFQILRPRFELSQKETLDWIVDAHVKAEGDESMRPALTEKLWRVGCKPEHIAKRGTVFNDFSHRDWDNMEIYRLSRCPSGRDLSVRSKKFQLEAEGVFEHFFPEGAAPPEGLIQVSCTGYVSPSGAQTIVSKRNWGALTTVTQVHHMGCYAAIPAIRIGMGGLKNRTDIVHTEICSLHSNPSNHATDQLVTQSLFADGFIKYSVVRRCEAPHLRVVETREEIIPHSTQAMTWNVGASGFEMTLAKELPVLITRNLKGYLSRLCPEGISPNTLFAIHPGGPKILTYIQELLGLTDAQMTFSFQILKEYGNMSSATLPHVWARILDDANIPSGTPILSLAFGPGLTIAGSLMEKICGN